MKPQDLKTLTLEKVCLHNIEGYWTESRVDKKTIPEDYEAFECRDDGSSGEPLTIEKDVLVNFWGTFIVPRGVINLEKEEYEVIYIDTNDENDTINYLDDGLYKLIDGDFKKEK